MDKSGNRMAVEFASDHAYFRHVLDRPAVFTSSDLIACTSKYSLWLKTAIFTQ